MAEWQYRQDHPKIVVCPSFRVAEGSLGSVQALLGGCVVN